MAKVTIPPAQSERQLQTYTPDFLKWKGFVDEIPVLNSAVEARADAITASWRCYGARAKEAANMMDNFRGNGKQTFKGIVNNMWKIAYICGDAFAEIVFNRELGIENLRLLCPNDVKIHIDNGEIKEYEDVNGGEKFRPEEIFHYAHNPLGATVHGRSGIEPMNDNLIAWRQLMDDMSKIFHRYIKPIHVIEYETDDTVEIDKFKDEWKKIKNIPEADIHIPKDTIKITRASIPQGSTLDPQIFNRILIDQMMMSTRVPELALGTGSVNSEESAKMQFMGFRQAVRHDQKMLEEAIRTQLLWQVFPEDTPKLKWSFASEPQEESYKRLRDTFQTIAASPLADDVKGLILANTLYEMGVIEDVGRERKRRRKGKRSSGGGSPEAPGGSAEGEGGAEGS